jgi:hypothetical protein
MSTNRPQILPAVSESAVSETVKQVSAKALELSTRRNEINRRIGFLSNVMKGLRNVATGTTYKGHDLTAISAAGATEPSGHVNELTRACRIALVESEGCASIDEIRRRIARRESFVFAGPGSAKAAIHRTLRAMTASGEVRRLDSGSKLLWQRNAPEFRPRNFCDRIAEAPFTE